MAAFTRETVKIPSVEKGVDLDVWLYTPTDAGPGPFPVVIAGHGLTLTKDAGLAPFAQRWAADAGYAALVLDYRRFGTSGGAPRGLVVLRDQRADFASVLEWARSHPALFRADKIVLMGSASGGLAVAHLLVEDAGLAGGMAHCPLLDGKALIASLSPNPRFLFWAIVDRIAGALGLPPIFIKAIGKPGELAYLNSPSSFDGFTAMFAQGVTPFSQTANIVAPRLAFDVMSCSPGLRLKDAKAPMLVVMAEDDDLIPSKVTTDVVDGAAGKVKLVVSPGGHYDVMKGGQGFETNINAQLGFLRGLL